MKRLSDFIQEARRKYDILAANKQECINALYDANDKNSILHILLKFVSPSLFPEGTYAFIKQLLNQNKIDIAKNFIVSQLQENTINNIEESFNAFINANLNEGIFSKAAPAAALAATMANANAHMQPVHGFDTRYGAKTATEFQQRYNHKLDADKFDYKLDSIPDTLTVKTDSNAVDLVKQKILSTPNSILTTYGKNNAAVIAKAIVNAANKYDIDENILMAMLSTETGFNQLAVSHTGVKSIAQITTDTFNSLQNGKHIDKSHKMENIKSNVTDAINAAANIIDYMSTHMHNNIEMTFAEYNGGSTGGASPYRMYRQGKTKEQIIKWMKDNKCSERTINHFFDETIPYVNKCMAAYHRYLEFDNKQENNNVAD